MKTIAVSIFIACAVSASAQTDRSRKDTVKVDSSHVERIKKMPMDTALHNMPVVPVTPPEQPKSTPDPNRQKSQEQKKQPIH